MRFLGHPIHPMLVHFPIVFWLSGSVLDILFWLNWVANSKLAIWCLGLGSASGALAVVLGFVDMLKLEERFVKIANLHAALMCSAWLLFLASFFIRFQDIANRNELTIWILTLNLAGTFTLVAGGVKGGELVHKHGVTLKPNCIQPNPDRPDNT
ncbi:DUF2231 domain-containing protein [Sulfitobacter sp. F26204]|uniref:DUF2231 domain-containing protein n=1 Tax=Sulfitobacter sp. F26204 TaxID=2996014 RepID=UPI003A4C6C13